jgi:predicted nucleic-acid-binding Zn-ribbon protein
MTESKTCPKCNGSMSSGKILGRNQYIAKGQYMYLFAPDNEPGPSLAQAFSSKPAGRKGLLAYCCNQCGFVEFYGQSLG